MLPTEPDILPASNESPDNPREQTPLAYRLVRGGAAVALSSYFLFAFGFVSNLVLTRLLAPADFGVFALGAFFAALLSLRPKLGVEQAFAQHKGTDAQVSGTFAALSIATGLASLLLCLVAVPILTALGYSSQVIVVVLTLAGVGVMDSIMGIAWVQLDKALLFGRVSLVTTIAFPLSYLPAFYLAFQQAGYWALLAQNIAYSVLLLIGLWFTARRALPQIWSVRWQFSQALAKQFLRFGIFVGAATIFTTIIYQFDNFLVGTIVSTEELGYYDRAYRIAQWSYVLVASVIARTAFYAYSRVQDDAVRLSKAVTMVLWIITTLTVPVALAVFVSADALVLFLFGEKWLASALLLKFLIVYSILRPLLDNAGLLLTATGHPQRNTAVTIAQAAALVIVATPLTFRLGAVGTAIGVGIAFLVGLAIMYYYIRAVLPGFPWHTALLSPFLISIVTLAVGLSSAAYIQTLTLSLWLELASQIAICLGCYWGMTFLLHPRMTRERSQYLWSLFRGRTPA